MYLEEFEIFRDLILWRRGYETFTYIALVNAMLVALSFRCPIIASCAFFLILFLFFGASKPRFKDSQGLRDCSNYTLLNDIAHEFVQSWFLLLLGVMLVTIMNQFMKEYIQLRFIIPGIFFDICLFITKKYSFFELEINRNWLKELICKEIDYFKWFSLNSGIIISKPIMQQLDYIDKLDYYEIIRYQTCVLQSLIYFENNKKIIMKAHIEKKIKSTLPAMWSQYNTSSEFIVRAKIKEMPRIYSLELDRQGKETFLLKELSNLVSQVVLSDTNLSLDELKSDIDFNNDSLKKMPKPKEIMDDMVNYLKTTIPPIETSKKQTAHKNTKYNNSSGYTHANEKFTKEDIIDGKWMNEVSDPRLKQPKEKAKASKEKIVEEKKYQTPKYSGIEKSEKQRRIEEKRRLKKMMEADEKKRIERERLAKLEEAERARHAKQEEERRKRQEQEEEERRKKQEEEEKRKQEEEEARLLHEALKSSKSDIDDDKIYNDRFVSDETQNSDLHEFDMSSSSPGLQTSPEEQPVEVEHHHTSRWRRNRSEDEPRKRRNRNIEHEASQAMPIPSQLGQQYQPQQMQYQQQQPQGYPQFTSPQFTMPQPFTDLRFTVPQQFHQMQSHPNTQAYIPQYSQPQTIPQQIPQPIPQPPEQPPEQRGGLFSLNLDALRRRRKRRADPVVESPAYAMPQMQPEVVQNVEPWVAEPVANYGVQAPATVNFDAQEYNVQQQPFSLDDLARPRRRKRNPL